MTEQWTKWCLGQPQIGIRQLDETERRTLAARIRTTMKRRLWEKRVLLSIWIVISLIGIAFVICTIGNESHIALAVEAAFGIMIMTGSVAGSLYILAFPPNWWCRPLIGVFFLGAMLLASFEDHLPETIKMICLFTTCAIIFIGNTMLFLQTREWRRFALSFQSTSDDLLQGKVLQFGHSYPGFEDGRSAEHDLEEEQETYEEPRIMFLEVLPGSRLLYSMNWELVSTWEIVRIVNVANAPLASRVPENAPYSVTQAEPQKTAFGEFRTMTTEELTELQQKRGSRPRRILLESLGVAWITAFGVQLVGSFIHGKLSLGLSAQAWIVVGVITLAWISSRIRRWYLVGQDILARKVHVVRLPVGAGENIPSETETLPKSKIVWRRNRKPEPWRL